MDNFVKLVAILGFILACISLLWHVWTYHVSHKEKLGGKLSITAVPISSRKNVPALQLDIWNDGYIPVYIKSVGLTWGDEGPQLGNVLNALEFKEYPPKKGPLKPGDGTKYVLPAIIPEMLAKANELPKNKLWVSVKSQKEELLRFQDNNLKVYLGNILEGISKGSNKNEDDT